MFPVSHNAHHREPAAVHRSGPGTSRKVMSRQRRRSTRVGESVTKLETRGPKRRVATRLIKISVTEYNLHRYGSYGFRSRDDKPCQDRSSVASPESERPHGFIFHLVYVTSRPKTIRLFSRSLRLSSLLSMPPRHRSGVIHRSSYTALGRSYRQVIT